MLRDYIALLLRLPGDRVRLGVLLAGLAVTALLETAGIALVLPFVALVQRDENDGLPTAVAEAAQFLGSPSRSQLIVACGIVLASVFVLKALFVTVMVRLQMRFIYRRMMLVMKQLLASYVTRPYTFHLQHNSAELVRNVMTDTYGIFYQGMPALFLFAVEALTCSVTALLLIALEPVAVPLAALATGAAGFALYRLYRTRLVRMGQIAREHQGQMLRRANQAFGGVKEAMVLGREQFFIEEFAKDGDEHVAVLKTQRTLFQAPRLTLEALGVIGLVLLTLITMARESGPARLVPMLGVLAIAVVRLVPSAARMVAATADVRYLSAAVRSTRRDLEYTPAESTSSSPAPTPLPFERDIRVVDLRYRYPGAASDALAGVTLTINKGEAIALVGGSGAGKTTLVDTLIGLLSPSSGRIEVDGRALTTPTEWRAWRRHIGYIPQQVYLCDDTLRRNIAFGVPDGAIDESAIRQALKAARLEELVASMPEGLGTVIGERGVRLSGGQRQRIGIARALYLDPSVLVLDEATSALDGVTEAEVVEAIESARKERTLIVIAHRLSTVRNCDRLVFLSGGRVDHVGTWEALRENSADFRRMAELAGH